MVQTEVLKLSVFEENLKIGTQVAGILILSFTFVITKSAIKSNFIISKEKPFNGRRHDDAIYCLVFRSKQLFI